MEFHPKTPTTKGRQVLGPGQFPKVAGIRSSSGRKLSATRSMLDS